MSFVNSLGAPRPKTEYLWNPATQQPWVQNMPDGAQQELRLLTSPWALWETSIAPQLTAGRFQQEKIYAVLLQVSYRLALWLGSQHPDGPILLEAVTAKAAELKQTLPVGDELARLVMIKRYASGRKAVPNRSQLALAWQLTDNSFSRAIDEHSGLKALTALLTLTEEPVAVQAWVNWQRYVYPPHVGKTLTKDNVKASLAETAQTDVLLRLSRGVFLPLQQQAALPPSLAGLPSLYKIALDVQKEQIDNRDEHNFYQKDRVLAKYLLLMYAQQNDRQVERLIKTSARSKAKLAIPEPNFIDYPDARADHPFLSTVLTVYHLTNVEPNGYEKNLTKWLPVHLDEWLETHVRSFCCFLEKQNQMDGAATDEHKMLMLKVNQCLFTDIQALAALEHHIQKRPLSAATKNRSLQIASHARESMMSIQTMFAWCMSVAQSGSFQRDDNVIHGGEPVHEFVINSTTLASGSRLLHELGASSWRRKNPLACILQTGQIKLDRDGPFTPGIRYGEQSVRDAVTLAWADINKAPNAENDGDTSYRPNALWPSISLLIMLSFLHRALPASEPEKNEDLILGTKPLWKATNADPVLVASMLSATMAIARATTINQKSSAMSPVALPRRSRL